jgi:hypothetical protein
MLGYLTDFSQLFDHCISLHFSAFLSLFLSVSVD